MTTICVICHRYFSHNQDHNLNNSIFLILEYLILKLISMFKYFNKKTSISEWNISHFKIKYFTIAGGGYRGAVPGREEHGRLAAVQAGNL